MRQLKVAMDQSKSRLRLRHAESKPRHPRIEALLGLEGLDTKWQVYPCWASRNTSSAFEGTSIAESCPFVGDQRKSRSVINEIRVR